MATNEELISNLKFNPSFKNAIRDYFIYGFKGFDSYPEDNQTLEKDWKRLKNILHNYMEWSNDDEKNERIYFSQDSSSMTENPFYRIYKFCLFNNNDVSIFFNLIFALAPKINLNKLENKSICDKLAIDLNEEVKKQSHYRYIEFIKDNKNVKLKKTSNYLLFVDDSNFIEVTRRDEKFVEKLMQNLKDEKFVEKLMQNSKDGTKTIDAYEKKYIDNVKKDLQQQFDQLEEALKKKKAGLSAAQLKCFYPNKVGVFNGDNKAINLRLNEMKNIGILENNQASKKKWSLQELVLKDILKIGQKKEKDFEQDFETRFETAMDFYSRYSILGVYGSFILDRLEKKLESPFRFKHEYFMQGLNQYNLIDLLDVIEHEKWCEINYKHGTGAFTSTILCKPLEIRVSYLTGREFLIFYNPVKRCCSSLRLEFIENIICYEEKNVLDALKKNKIYKEDVISDLKNTMQGLEYMWGVSFSESREENVKTAVKPKTIQFNISYDEKTEPYIKKRLIQESRNRKIQYKIYKGTITFTAEIADPVEIRPWIRSLYSRLSSYSGIETKSFSIKSDVEKCISSIEKLEKNVIPPTDWKNKEATLDFIKGGKQVRKHEDIFNEIFSIYYHMIAKVLLECCSLYEDRYVKPLSSENHDMWRKTLSKKTEYIEYGYVANIIRKVRKAYENQSGIETGSLFRNKIERLIKNEVFGKVQNKKIYFKYECDSNIDFYRDILPLTAMEIRWLKTILADPHIGCFFNDDQIKAVNILLNEKFSDLKKLPMEKIIFFDQHTVNSKVKAAEKEKIPIIIKAIHEEKLLNISYTTRKGNQLTGNFRPVVLEYSKRNNKFQACFQSCKNDCKNDRFYYMNIFQINTISTTEDKFNRSETLKQYKQYRQKTQRFVKLEFYDEKNLPDRILMEFSPWKKYCSYNPKTNLYSLKIFYQKSDELEILIRLMGYAPDIHLVDKENTITKQMLNRLEKQKELSLTIEQQREENVFIK